MAVELRPARECHPHPTARAADRRRYCRALTHVLEAASQIVRPTIRHRRPAAGGAARRLTQVSIYARGEKGESPHMLLPALSVLEGGWHRLCSRPAELRLHATLANGQAFNWARLGADASDTSRPWVGVIGERVILLREDDAHVDFCCPSSPDECPERLREVLGAYFQLEQPLAALYAQWRSADERTSAVLDALPGLRILRQEPTECLFSFICSSNNNIGRITGILARLRAAYGRNIPIVDPRPFQMAASTESVPAFFTFPSVERLAAVPDAELRALGLGYRARYIRETAALLLEKGGTQWLLGQRGRPRDEVQAALIELSGVGCKVADCVALFSLDQPATIPVDVHVWQIACRDYDQSLLVAKSLTPTVYSRVGDLFRQRFGSHAGWAHSVLFAAELPAFRSLLPDSVQLSMERFRLEERERSAQKRQQKKQRAADGAPAEAMGDADAPMSPKGAAAAARSRLEVLSPELAATDAQAAGGFENVAGGGAKRRAKGSKRGNSGVATVNDGGGVKLAAVRADAASTPQLDTAGCAGAQPAQAPKSVRSEKRVRRAIVLSEEGSRQEEA